MNRGRGGGRGGSQRGRGERFKKSDPNEPRVNSEVQIFVENLPRGIPVYEVCQFFGTVGKIKIDRLTKNPRVWLYHDKSTNEPTGEATITYCDNKTQIAALQTYNGVNFNGNGIIRVTPSIVKSHMSKAPPPKDPNFRGRGRGRPRGSRGRGSRGGASFGEKRKLNSNEGFHGAKRGRFNDQEGFRNSNRERLGDRRGFDPGDQRRGGGFSNQRFGDQNRSFENQSRSFSDQNRSFDNQSRSFGGRGGGNQGWGSRFQNF